MNLVAYRGSGASRDIPAMCDGKIAARAAPTGVWRSLQDRGLPMQRGADEFPLFCKRERVARGVGRETVLLAPYAEALSLNPAPAGVRVEGIFHE